MVNALFVDNVRSGNILAPALKPGDTIGIVSPSWFGGEAFLPRAQRGITQLQRLGFRVRVAEHAFNHHGHVSDSAENRVADLHAMFADPEVAAILATIGGDHSCHLLPLIDWNLIRSNPKIFMGFSDMTVLNVAIWSQTGLVTFNGPALLTDWAEFPEMPAFSSENALRDPHRRTDGQAGALPLVDGGVSGLVDGRGRLAAKTPGAVDRLALVARRFGARTAHRGSP